MRITQPLNRRLPPKRLRPPRLRSRNRRKDLLLLSLERTSMLLASMELSVKKLLAVEVAVEEVANVVDAVASVEAVEASAVAVVVNAEVVDVEVKDAPESKVRKVRDPRELKVNIVKDAQDLKAKRERDVPEPKVAEAEVADHPEPKVLREKRLLLTPEERDPSMTARSTDLPASPEVITPSTERTEPEEAEVLPRVALERPTGEQLKMKSSKAPLLRLRKVRPQLRKLRLRMLQRPLRPPRRLLQLMLRRRNPRANLPLLSILQTRRSQSRRRKPEATKRSRELMLSTLLPRTRKLSLLLTT